jgi:hypothetical protein
MPSLQHLLALWVLAHMCWAAVLLEKEWRRIRRFTSSEDPSALTGAEDPQVTFPHL